MSQPSSIEWTGMTWNPVTGCTEVSPGCDLCYAGPLPSGGVGHRATRTSKASTSSSGPSGSTNPQGGRSRRRGS